MQDAIIMKADSFLSGVSRRDLWDAQMKGTGTPNEKVHPGNQVRIVTENLSWTFKC
jgi:hypothetical protein